MSTTTTWRSAELQAIDRITDPDWKQANEICYRVGIKGLADVVYRVIKSEQRIAFLEGEFTKLEARVSQLEARTKTK
jgi:hypothetical protein